MLTGNLKSVPSSCSILGSDQTLQYTTDFQQRQPAKQAEDTQYRTHDNAQNHACQKFSNISSHLVYLLDAGTIEPTFGDFFLHYSFDLAVLARVLLRHAKNETQTLSLAAFATIAAMPFLRCLENTKKTRERGWEREAMLGTSTQRAP